ncbi:MAG: hypothetical protein BAJALOKI1v1_730004 [Promethearchaeota archaeon]|nr:MAG: hypothetical protein BAJALOKI1v1_730004 [Candidatus Lokiarchaeota archaeon]
MSIDKSNFEDLEECEKCTSQMITRKIPIKENGSFKWQKIRQCILCKHWYSFKEN